MAVPNLDNGRITPRLKIDDTFISETLKEYNLTSTGDQEFMGGGRIANNIRVSTVEKGDLVLRVYPRSYGRSKVLFEIEALVHFSKKGVAVPSLLETKKIDASNGYMVSTDKVDAFVYTLLPGKTLEQSQISEPMARAAGAMLAKMCSQAKSFRPTKLAPHGDLGFISGLLRAAKERDRLLASHQIAGEMESVVSDLQTIEELSKTSKGLVHADYFFENLLVENGQVTGVLDFGDAYYGHVVNDAIIGAMEFAVLENESWRVDFWSAFLRENKQWLIEEHLTPKLAKTLLLANCVRFAIYTLPFSYQQGETIESNKYIRRFNDISHGRLGPALEGAYEEALWG